MRRSFFRVSEIHTHLPRECLRHFWEATGPVHTVDKRGAPPVWGWGQRPSRCGMDGHLQTVAWAILVHKL